LRYLDRLQPLGLLALRVVLGVIMIGHSYGKVFGGEQKAVTFITGLGLPWWLTYFSMAAEFGGGILVILGLFTRCAAIAILIDMMVAIWKVHWKNGLLGEHGYQFTLTLAAVAFALIFFGAGPIALDSVRRGGGSRKKAAK
jgi:putative oxidoreductase